MISHLRRKQNKFADWNVGDRYICKSILGRGAYGQVCKALDVVSGQEVAIKQIKNVFQCLGDALRIVREIQILAQLNCKQIVKLRDIIIPDRQSNFSEIYLVMDLSETDIGELLKSTTQLSEKQVIKIMYNILRGIKFMHTANVVHRDLKPSNILINSDCSIWIADFGLSRSLPKCHKDCKQSNDTRNLTATRAPIHEPSLDHSMHSDDSQDKPKKIKRSLSWYVGTRTYRSPEIVLLRPDYGFAYDMWSAGVILAELLATMQETKQPQNKRRSLFNGQSCFPMSLPKEQMDEDAKGNPIIPDTDHLVQLLQVLGTPTDEDLRSLGDDQTIEYLSSVINSRAQMPRMNFASKYPNASNEMISLLDSLLQFNPDNRPTVEQALEQSLFDGIRSGRKEKSAKNFVHIPADAYDLQSLDERYLRKELFGLFNRFSKK